jgi:urease alpha subunit
MTRTTLGLAAMAVAVLSSCADTAAPTSAADAAPSFRAGTVTTRETFDTTIVAFEPCAGEDVAFHLREQRVRHTTVDANGVIHDLEVTNDKGTRAVGLVTGRVWNQTGATVNHINIDLTEDDVDNQTIVNTLNLIGPGSTPNIKVQEVFHVTVNAQGVITSLFVRMRTSCG